VTRIDEELTPQQTERVRRLLAEARHDEPMPDDVAARLDRVVADLADDPAARPSPVVRLAERRRRVGRLLLAAAAVVVGGVAVAQLVDNTSISGMAGSDEASVPSEAEGQGLPAPDRDSASRDSESADELAEQGAGLPGAVSLNQQSISRLPPQQVRSTRFAGDAEQLRPAALGTDRRSGRRAPRTAAADVASCSPGTWGGGRYLRVVVDRDAGWLVYRPPRGDTQVVDLFLCGDDAPERSTTLPFG